MGFFVSKTKEYYFFRVVFLIDVVANDPVLERDSRILTTGINTRIKMEPWGKKGVFAMHGYQMWVCENVEPELTNIETVFPFHFEFDGDENCEETDIPSFLASVTPIRFNTIVLTIFVSTKISINDTLRKNADRVRECTQSMISNWNEEFLRKKGLFDFFFSKDKRSLTFSIFRLCYRSRVQKFGIRKNKTYIVRNITIRITRAFYSYFIEI